MRLRVSTKSIAAASARRPWRTIGLWLLLLVAAGVVTGTLGMQFTDEDDFTSNPDSKQANTLISERIGEEPLRDFVIVRSEETTVDDPAFRTAVDETAANLNAMTGVVASTTTYYQTRDAGDPAADDLVSDDRHSTLITAMLAGEYDDLIEHGAQFIATAQAQRANGFEVYAFGELSDGEIYDKMVDEDMAKAEQVGLPVALIVLVVVFGALVAAFLPVVLGLVSIFTALGIIAAASQVVEVADLVTIMVAMIGLAVGIDYALFIIERYREERRGGVPKQEAIAVAGGTAGKAVIFSGCTVILSLFGLFLIPSNVFQSMALGAIVAVIVAICATQTLVPALLGVLGDRIDWPRRRNYDTPSQSARNFEKRGVWGRLSGVVMRRPVVALVLATAILVAAALPALDLETGQVGIDSLPPSDAKTGYEILQREFYAGETAPVEIVIDRPVNDAQAAAGIDNLLRTLASDPFYGSPHVTQSAAGDLTIVSAPIDSESSEPEALDAVKHLRSDVIPAAFGDAAEDVYVGGSSATEVDIATVLGQYTPLIFLFVLGLSFLLLMVAFHSIVVPLKAIVLNLLSVGAAYGLIVAVFQKGIGADLLGMNRGDRIESWIPLFLFCILFGLSMDYHVFLLSRIRERFDQTGRNTESVAFGLRATGKIITGAALIMVAVFSAFAMGRFSDIQQLGFGLAVAIFLDATIVRSIMVPASMKLLGNWNWYLPRWLSWLPDLRIEGVGAGHEASAERIPEDGQDTARRPRPTQHVPPVLPVNLGKGGDLDQ